MLRRLYIEHFRNYDQCELEFSPGVNVLLGRNGQGKTNILEAVYYLSLLRSFRTSRLEHLQQFGWKNFTVSGELVQQDGTVRRLGVSAGDQRRLVVDGIHVGRASEFISKLICTAFIPEDLAIVRGAPGGRRRFVNIAISQLSPAYLADLQAFVDALRSRNAMLKQLNKYPHETITAWDTILLEKGARIEAARRRFANELNLYLDEISQNFFPDGRKLTVALLSGISTLVAEIPESYDEIHQIYSKNLRNCYERDCRDGATRLGPHHSDLSCMLGGRLLNVYGSEGECRTGALALKLALLKCLRTCRPPEDITMIVDDVMGELDDTRRQAFLNQLVASGQVIFAGTAIPQGFPPERKVFIIDGGRLQN